MTWQEQKTREAEVRRRERASIVALHAAGRPCGRQHCPACAVVAETLREEWA